MIKKIAVKAGVLTAVFIATVILFSYLTNRGNTDMSADMGSATLPRISFTTEGYEVNSLPGYKTEMLIPSMRDTLTLVSDYRLQMNIQKYDAKIKGVTWQIYTLNGEECLQEETIKNVEDTIELKLKADAMLDKERVLKVTLHLEDQDIFYYTRVKDAADCNYKSCLDFANDFHTTAITKENADSLSEYLEPNAESDNTTLQKVTIHSDLDHITWGGLKPEIVGSVQWEVKECNENYTSILLDYQVKCPGAEDNPDALYTVKEFFRIRLAAGVQYLLNYDRTTDQVFDGQTAALNHKGILLGMAPTDLEYKNNSEGTIVSFVQNKELWNYDKEADEMSLIFSFADAEKVDIRNRYDRHEIHIVAVDKEGNTTFTVSGYMNRGIHEGQLGVAVYYFDSEKNSVEERAFVPSIKGYDVMCENLGKYVYFSNESENLYVMVDGTLYCVNLEEDTREVLVRGLDDGQYKVSEDGHLLAYQMLGGKLNESQKITVLNRQSGKSFDITSEGEEYLRPIGFIRDDFAYGRLRQTDAGITTAGKTENPMFKVEIISQKQKVVKTYEIQDIFILDGYVDKNMLTLSRVVKNGGGYTAVTADYITNNEEKKESNITLETYSDEVRERLVRLTYEDGISDSRAKLLKPKQVLFDKPVVIRFDETETEQKYYVYALGKLQGVYDKASYAVRRANETEGTAISSRQAYIWERGNTPTIYEVDNMQPFSSGEGESTLQACLRQIIRMEGQEADVAKELADGMSPEEILSAYTGGEGLDLTGCTTEEILYTISRETPVIAMLDGDHAVLLIGYNGTNVVYLDPADGQRHSTSKETMETMVNTGGNTFIGYAK